TNRIVGFVGEKLVTPRVPGSSKPEADGGGNQTREKAAEDLGESVASQRNSRPCDRQNGTSSSSTMNVNGWPMMETSRAKVVLVMGATVEKNHASGAKGMRTSSNTSSWARVCSLEITKRKAPSGGPPG